MRLWTAESAEALDELSGVVHDAYFDAADVVVLHSARHRGRPRNGHAGLIEVVLLLTRSEPADGHHPPSGR
jgi:hypothetical protein